MTDYREILRLRNLRYSQRAIARSVRCSRNTVEKDAGSAIHTFDL